MIDRIENDHGIIVVHLTASSLKATKSFTHGRITFDRRAGTASFGSLPPVSLPSGLDLVDGGKLDFQLAGPDGKLRKQTRTGIVIQAKDTEMFHISGCLQTPARFTAENGWGIEVYKFRAYYTHPGLDTTGGIPEWLQESIDRQRAFWNRLAWLCREARRKCSPDATEEVKQFVSETILPAIDMLNSSMERTEPKLRHPKKLKIKEPNVDGLYNFLGILRLRVERRQPVPDGLIDQVLEFATRFKPDYKPIDDFLNKVRRIAAKEAADLGLTWYESGPMLKRFMAVLKARKTFKRSWSEGWPFIKYPDSPRAKNWSLTYYLNKSGLQAAKVDTGNGVSGLRLGAPKSVIETGHLMMVGLRTHRQLREATIVLRGMDNKPMEFRFGVLEHRPLPPDAHIKQWQIAEVDGRLWLNLTLEVKRDAPRNFFRGAAGLDIGWRRTKEGIRIGVLYEPIDKTSEEIVLDFRMPPKDPTERTPFRLNLGPTRWERRNITKIIPDWKPGDALPGTVVLRSILDARRSALKDTAKAQLKSHLGENTPAWFDRAGKKGLLKLAEDFNDDLLVQRVVGGFSAETDALNQLTAAYLENSSHRIEYGYQQIAHDVLKQVQSKGLNRIFVEKEFLVQAAGKKPDRDEYGYYSLVNSGKYRQFAAVGKFIASLKMIARKYGILVEEKETANTTRLCAECGHLNPATAEPKYECEACHRMIDPDYNAAVNLAKIPASELDEVGTATWRRSSE